MTNEYEDNLRFNICNIQQRELPPSVYLTAFSCITVINSVK